MDETKTVDQHLDDVAEEVEMVTGDWEGGPLVSISVELEEKSDEELSQLYQQIGQLIAKRKQAAKQAAADKIKELMAAAGLSARDLTTPVTRTSNGGSTRPTQSGYDRYNPQFGKNKMLPALEAILKSGPLDQNELRLQLKNKYGLPFNTMGMMIRWGYVGRREDGLYEWRGKVD